MTATLTALLRVLRDYKLNGSTRSFMANVTGRKKWSPVHDRLHYALISGEDGIKRWHLVHPDAMPVLESLGHEYTLHDQLGGEVRSGSDLLPETTRNFHANRVSAVLADHPDLGTFVVKGSEAHTDLNIPSSTGKPPPLITQRDSTPPRSLRWSEHPDPRKDDVELHLHTDLQPYEMKIREKMRMAPISHDSDGVPYLKHNRSAKKPRDVTDISEQLERAGEGETEEFSKNAEWFTHAAMISGAPVVPLYRGHIGDLADAANAAGEDSGHKNWYQRDYQAASFQPFIHPPKEAAEKIGLESLPIYSAKVTQEESDWVERLQGRLGAAQDIASAPDCHARNYVDVPAITPTGKVIPVPHGIDYEWIPSYDAGGILAGRAEAQANTLDDAGHDHSTRPRDSGVRDVASTVHHWPPPSDYGLDSYNDEALEESSGYWHEAKDLAQDHSNNTLQANAARLHERFGERDHSKSEIKD